MKKRPRVAILNTIEASRANLIEGTNGWSFVKTSAGMELLLGTFQTGKLKRVESFDPVAEVKQIVTIGADVTPETIVAATRYKLEIGNPDDKYETGRRHPIIHAYTSATVLSGNAATDRTNVYTALVNKVNAYAGNNVTAYVLTQHDYTLGTDGAGSALNFTVGEVVTQQTSTETARVAKCLISTGTMAGDNAAGVIWVFAISDTVAWLDTAVTLTGGTSLCVATQTVSTQIDGGGLVVEDDAGYFISNIARAGINWVGATQGWTVSATVVGLAGVYSMGIGSVMAQLIPQYDHSKQVVIRGFLEYELQNDDLFDVAKTYRKYVFTITEGDEDSMAGESQHTDQEVILYCDKASGNLSDLNTAIDALT